MALVRKYVSLLNRLAAIQLNRSIKCHCNNGISVEFCLLSDYNSCIASVDEFWYPCKISYWNSALLNELTACGNNECSLYDFVLFISHWFIDRRTKRFRNVGALFVLYAVIHFRHYQWRTGDNRLRSVRQAVVVVTERHLSLIQKQKHYVLY